MKRYSAEKLNSLLNLSEHDLNIIIRYIYSEHTIQAWKHYRTITGADLQEAKQAYKFIDKVCKAATQH